MISPVFARIRSGRPSVKSVAVMLSIVAFIAFMIATCIPSRSHAWEWWNKTYRDRNR